MSKKITHTDIIVVGAGITGIASAYYLKKKRSKSRCRIRIRKWFQMFFKCS